MANDTLRVSMYLWASDVAWSPELTTRLLEDLSDWLVERGFDNGSGNDALRALVSATNIEIPVDPDDLLDQFEEDGTGLIVFPSSRSFDD